MNLVVASPTWLVGLLMLVLAAAAVEDALRLKISNLTCSAVLLGAVAAMALNGFRFELWQNAAIFAIILAIGTAAFSVGLLGGGDVKLLAGIGLWLDFKTAVLLIVVIALTGGVVAIAYILSRRFRNSQGRSSKVPYGLAIVGGALLVFVSQLAQHPSDPLMDRIGLTRPRL